jgi:hypothetical protein
MIQNGALITKTDKVKSSDRKARTRTLIQLGSLLNLVDLPEIFGIIEGEDLQLDSIAHNKAATLLGFLVEATAALPPTLIEAQINHLKKIGIRHMKTRAYQK